MAPNSRCRASSNPSTGTYNCTLGFFIWSSLSDQPYQIYQRGHKGQKSDRTSQRVALFQCFLFSKSFSLNVFRGVILLRHPWLMQLRMGFSFYRALPEKRFFGSLFLSLAFFLAILLSSQFDLIKPKSVKLIWTHLHANKGRCVHITSLDPRDTTTLGKINCSFNYLQLTQDIERLCLFTWHCC